MIGAVLEPVLLPEYAVAVPGPLVCNYYFATNRAGMGNERKGLIG
jgi:hypothetical protein